MRDQSRDPSVGKDSETEKDDGNGGSYVGKAASTRPSRVERSSSQPPDRRTAPPTRMGTPVTRSMSQPGSARQSRATTPSNSRAPSQPSSSRRHGRGPPLGSQRTASPMVPGRQLSTRSLPEDGNTDNGAPQCSPSVPATPASLASSPGNDRPPSREISPRSTQKQQQQQQQLQQQTPPQASKAVLANSMSAEQRNFPVTIAVSAIPSAATPQAAQGQQGIRRAQAAQTVEGRTFKSHLSASRSAPGPPMTNVRMQPTRPRYGVSSPVLAKTSPQPTRPQVMVNQVKVPKSGGPPQRSSATGANPVQRAWSRDTEVQRQTS